MHTLFQRITSLILLLGIFLSGTGIGIAKHYCGGALTDIGLYSGTCCCDAKRAEPVEAAHTSCCAPEVEQPAESCCAAEHTSGPLEQDDQGSCCNTQVELKKIDIEARQNLSQEISKSLLVCHAVLTLQFVAALEDADVDSRCDNHGAGPPTPYQGRSICIVSQSFLL